MRIYCVAGAAAAATWHCGVVIDSLPPLLLLPVPLGRPPPPSAAAVAMHRRACFRVCVWNAALQLQKPAGTGCCVLQKLFAKAQQQSERRPPRLPLMRHSNGR